MANEEQLAILRQGVDVWNRWRDKSPGIDIDLKGADLRRADLSEANLRGADLRRTNLSEAHIWRTCLSEAQLWKANLISAELVKADLSEANLSEADLFEANLHGVNLAGANLRGAELIGAHLSESEFRASDLSQAYFQNTNILRSNFSKARIQNTTFLTLDLSKAIGLDDLIHEGPSQISTDTFVLSLGKIPENFLRGCGLSDWEIEHVKLYNPDLNNDGRNKILYKVYDLQATQAIQISPLFISYSHADSIFVDKVEQRLKAIGIRFWRDIHEMKAGRIETQIDKGIRQNPTVLLILSKGSTSSDWVEHEIRTARALEKESGRDVLCPIALDDSWKSSPWPARVMEQIMEYNILDFSEWEDDVKFESMFRKLIDGLELFYKG